MANPILRFFTTAGATITGLDFGTIQSGEESAVFEVLLFNNKDSLVEVDIATGVIISVRDGDGGQTAEFITEGFTLARSAGLTNPNLSPDFFDDFQRVFTPITNSQELLVGDIPSGGGRSIFIKLSVPPNATTITGLTVNILAGHGSNTTPLPFYFNRAFGDGVIEEEKKQIYGTVLDDQVGSWTTLDAISGGLYTGELPKTYTIRVVTGGTLGVFEYKTSDDGGVTFAGTTVTSLVDAFTDVFTSLDVDEGVNIAWANLTGGIAAIGDQWSIQVETRPFIFKAGLTTALEGFVGAGEAFVKNNRVFHQTTTNLTLAADSKTFVFLGVDGQFTISTTSTPQDDKLLLGWFLTDSTRVIDQNELFLPITLSLDLDDGFFPIVDRLVGLTWTFFQGKFNKFNEIIRIPANPSLIGTISLIAGATNFIEVDVVAEDVVTNSIGFSNGNIPLFQVVTGLTFMEQILDERSNLGAFQGSLKTTFIATTSTVLDAATLDFDLPDFVNRGLVKKFTITPEFAVGGTYSLTFFSKDTHLAADAEFSDTFLPNPFTSSTLFMYEDKDITSELHGRIVNFTGATQTFGISMEIEQFA